MLKIISIAMLVTCSIFYLESSYASESNKEQVKRSVMDGWNYTAWGVIIGDAEYVRFTGTLVEAALQENPAPIIRYFNNLAQRNVDKIQREITGISKRMLWQAIVDSMNSGRIMRYSKVDLKAGLATWQRWEMVSYDEPRTYKCKQYYDYRCPTFRNPGRWCEGWTWSVCSTTKRVKRKVPLPNWHMPYVSIRYR